MVPELIKLPLGVDAEAKLRRYLRDRIRAQKAALRELHEVRVVKWRRAYEAMPAEEIREFPFHNASNLVVPIIAIHSDTLLARLMSAVIKTQPPWVARVIGSGLQDLQNQDGLRDAIEEFLQYVALEPTELDLYRVYHEWFGETIRFGTSTLKVPYEVSIEDTVVPSGDGSGDFEWLRRTKYEGPRPEKIPFQDFLISPESKTLEAADFKAHRIRIQRNKLEERGFTGVYDQAKVKEIIKSPDRSAPDVVLAAQAADSGVQGLNSYGWAEWDIYECWFRYKIGRRYANCIAWYHEKSDTLLRCFFNYYPVEPFVTARLFYRDDFFFGYGFCEILWNLQEEISQIHNQRRDNVTVANTRVWRVNPDSKLHQGYRIFPSAMLPAEPGEIEPLEHGVGGATIDIAQEQLALELAEKRSGVTNPQQGMGSGQFSKRGVYSAMGTMSLLQEGNTRTDLNITDMRYAHTKLGRLLCSLYGEFGIGNQRLLSLGKIGPTVETALKALNRGQMALPVTASTSSTNREVEKQNDMVLSGVMSKHYQTVTAMLQAASNPVVPENVRKYLTSAIDSSEIMMKSILKHFGYDEVDRLVPTASEPAPPGGGTLMPGAPPAAGPQGANSPQGQQIMAAIAAVQGGGQ
jgi:hypothetical protein